MARVCAVETAGESGVRMASVTAGEGATSTSVHRAHRLAGTGAVALLVVAAPVAALSVRTGLGLIARPSVAATVRDGGVAPGTVRTAALPGSAAPAPPPVQAAIPSPAAGTTGTTDLPPLPASVVPAATMPGDTGVVPARPFAMAGIAAIDRARALECLTAAVYYESASEPDDGQRAVAQVILNRVRHPAFPATVCGVVYQGSERSGCQFSFACDGAMARIPSRTAWARAARNAAIVLNGPAFAPVGLATHYHTYAVTPAWNRSLVMTDAIGAHFFHRWKGFWGTAAAFTQRYRGGEPMPGPHARVSEPLPMATPVIAAAGIVSSRVVVTPPVSIQPANAQSGQPVVAPARDTLLPDSQILDRWKDSGKPLR